MDSYHAPYKAKHRYKSKASKHWPGLLLVLRFILLLVFALNINLLAILVTVGILVGCMGLGQSWGLEELVSRCPGRFVCPGRNHFSFCHLPCQSFGRKSACSWVHLCFHSIFNVHCNSCLSGYKCDWHHSLKGSAQLCK